MTTDWMSLTAGMRITSVGEQVNAGEPGYRVVMTLEGDDALVLQLKSLAPITASVGPGEDLVEILSDSEWTETGAAACRRPADAEEVRSVFLKLWDAASPPTYDKKDWKLLWNALHRAGYFR